MSCGYHRAVELVGDILRLFEELRRNLSGPLVPFFGAHQGFVRRFEVGIGTVAGLEHVDHVEHSDRGTRKLSQSLTERSVR